MKFADSTRSLSHQMVKETFVNVSRLIHVMKLVTTLALNDEIKEKFKTLRRHFEISNGGRKFGF